MSTHRDDSDKSAIKSAKNYVEFYYYWLFNYCIRNYDKELYSKLPKDEYCRIKYNEDNAANAYKIYNSHPLRTLYNYILDENLVLNPENIFDDLDYVSWEYPISLLKKLYNDEVFDRQVDNMHDYGVHIIGTDGACLSEDGHLRGHIIAKIDINAPISGIMFHFLKLKNHIFKQFPSFSDGPNLFDIEGDYLLQKKKK